MKKKLLFILLNILFVSLLNATKLYEFPNLFKPLQIAVDNNYLYISDQYGVKIYSLDNYKYIRKIGQKGEGPGEFIYHPSFQVITNSQEILLYWKFKAVLFNFNGKILREKRFPYFITKLYKVSNNYIMSNWEISSINHKYDFIVFNKNFNKISTIEKKAKLNKIKTTGKFQMTLPPIPTIFKCSSDKIFLSNKKNNFYIEIYNHKGKKIKHIKKEYKNIKIDQIHKEKIKNDYFNQAVFKQSNKWQGKIEIVFREFYPAIQDFIIADNNIYIKTYLRKNKMHEFIILNFEGETLKRVFLPNSDNSLFSLASKLYTFNNNKYYYLKENEETEIYELFCVKIE